MSKYFYEWEDANDPYALGYPEMARYPVFRIRTKRELRAEWRTYVTELKRDAPSRVPKLRAWKISYVRVI